MTYALQPELKIFSGSANRELAQRICDFIGAPLGDATISSFPDGETYVKIEVNIRGYFYTSVCAARLSPSTAC